MYISGPRLEILPNIRLYPQPIIFSINILLSYKPTNKASYPIAKTTKNPIIPKIPQP
ncbi:MAG: hypothetical protein RSF13_05935 [Clostridiales bacterium]